jgi:hemoglobin/transferrin/lactoferrin receptor protein
MLSTNLSTGFRSPNVDDLGKVFDSAPGYVIVPNPDLEAEYAYNAELSIAKAFGDWLRVDVTGFYTILDNAMVRRDYTLNGQDSMMYDGTMSKIEAIQNAASAYVYGVEGGFEAKFKSGFGFSSRLNYQRGREELDDGTTAPLRSAAPLFGNTTFSYNYGKLNMQFYANFSGEVKFEDMPTDEIAKDYMYAIDEDGNPYSPKWITLNFKAMYHVSSDLMLSAGLENLLDKRYRSYSSGIVAPGRNFVLSFKYVF